MKNFRDTVEAFSPEKRASSIHNMTFLHFFIFLWVIFALLDPDPDPANHQNHCGSTTEENPNWPCTVPYLLIIFFLFASRPSVGSHMVQFLNSVYAQLCESPALHRFKQQNDSSKNIFFFYIRKLFAIIPCVVDPDPYNFGNLHPDLHLHPDPHPHQIKIRIRIRIHIKVIVWIWVHIKVVDWIRIRINLQMTSKNVWNISLFEHFFKGLSLYLEARIWIRIQINIKMKSQIRIRIK